MAQVYISVGSNIDKEINIPSAVDVMRGVFGELAVSSIYRCDALGFDGPEFYNLVVGFDSTKSVEEIVTLCKQIELQHGRAENAKKFTPRPLDLDLILYNQEIMAEPALIPRPEIKQYAFVLWPLAEIAGDVRHPECQTRFSELWEGFDKSSQTITKTSIKL